MTCGENEMKGLGFCREKTMWSWPRYLTSQSLNPFLHMRNSSSNIHEAFGEYCTEHALWKSSSYFTPFFNSWLAGSDCDELSDTPATLDTESPSGLSVCNTLNSRAVYHTFLSAVHSPALPARHCSAQTQCALSAKWPHSESGRLWHSITSALTSQITTQFVSKASFCYFYLFI